MCGRFVATQSPEQIAEHFGARPVAVLKPNWNVSPTQEIYAIHLESGTRVVDVMKWGFISRWAEETGRGPRPINARAETIATKRIFRDAFRKRRCLLPADGFYEWDTRKQPYFIRLASGDPMALGGIWEFSERNDVRSCAIITTAPNEVIKPIHGRMPVLIAKEYWNQWLDSTNSNISELKDLMLPTTLELRAIPVSRKLNNPRINSPDLINQLGDSSPT